MDFGELSATRACRKRCRRRLRTLVRAGSNVDRRDERGWNTLHESAASGCRVCVKEILSATIACSSDCRQTFVNSVTLQGESVCYLAAKNGHLSVLRLLLKAGANVNLEANDTSSPLFAAVQFGHGRIVDLLISKGAAVDKKHTASGWSCLHQAVYEDHRDILRQLVDVCILNPVDDYLISPLYLAAQYGREECMEILVNAGARVNIQTTDLATPLLIASQEGHKGCVDFLLDHGADPNIVCDSSWPQLAIHCAAELGHHSILRKLVTVTDPACGYEDGMVSPLYMAINKQDKKSMEILLREGYSPDGQDCQQLLGLRSPLSFASFEMFGSPYSECMKILIAAGATLTHDIWGFALLSRRIDLLKLILEHRWICRPWVVPNNCSAPYHRGRTLLRAQEVRDLLRATEDHVQFAALWIPMLLKAGLDPSLLLQPRILAFADNDVLNYLLEFVNWSTLSPEKKDILDQRRHEKTWEPSQELNSIIPLAHICRLRIRSILGPDLVMKTDVVKQLPLPRLLHNFLQFKDVKEPVYEFPTEETPAET